MEYLTGPRLNFTGKFIADVSTVNNFPSNYDGTNYTAADYANWDIGYWNPYGTGVWRLTDCAVTGAVRGDDGTRYPPLPDFTMGLITGSIGVASADEPRFFTLGRKLQPSQKQSQSAPTLFYYATAVVDEPRKALAIDFGNSIPFKEWRGDIVGETLQVGYLDAVQGFQPLGEVTPDNAWYQRTAGIADIALTDAQLSAVAANPLAVRKAGADTLLGQEPADGKALRADQFVFRMAPDDSAETTVWATVFGKPLADAEVALTFDNSSLGGEGDPPVGVPAGALGFPPSVRTDAAGKAAVKFSAGDPGQPRAVDDIDGQVYGVRPTLSDAGADSYGNPWDFISFLVWSGYEIPEEPSWEADIKPILAQYAALYPVMLPVLDMGDYDSVRKHLYSLQTALSLPEENPNYMPAVRDLSPNKKAAILKWAANPVRGTAPAKASSAGPVAEEPAAPATESMMWAAVQAPPAPDAAPHPATYLKK